NNNKKIKFYNFDLRNKDLLKKVFKENKIDIVIHFAGLKAVGESVSEPIRYYNNNIMSTLSLCEVMSEYKTKKLIFSSSATVYGEPKTLPIKEDFDLKTTNPYGSTKLIIENILKDLYISDNEWGIVCLRYFNPVGSHESGLIGEDPKGIPNNLMPYLVRVAAGELECLNIFGDDYDTPDGTGVRDYIHVVDLALGHLAAMNKIKNQTGVLVYNLGTGRGVSVLELVKTFEKTNNLKINYKIIGRRPGDIAACFADPSKAREELGWVAKKDIQDMCKDSWNFICNKNKK
ncbi:MAG: UDP-glucose 4-epimerase GalE, partial [Oscillospiraceae bacterium]|nr:UDP-glucose 4-epimerase GalE [Oscillospiraceae bacterium]